MEEAYNQLYQQFLCLRSLCLRQASLLNQLTAALQKQQGAAIPHGDSHGTRSTTVQENLRGAPEEQTPQGHVPAAGAPQWGFGGDASKTGASSTLLSPKVSELHADGGFCQPCPKHEAQDLALARSLETLGWQGASCPDPKTAQPLERPVRDTALFTLPATDRPFLADDFPSHSDGLLMSDVALQSHMCDFCQAVFPGDTTTRGEFLRHLYTHVT
ncbi:uncharacterized protein LOC142887113 isoform X2 [Nelusetta ayraudi]|uniref:uncharacterized protein LOC142887113 isoform X2 n=1 Tax=Nelusetta ayraudi TaxID=303726 RepID=UPI003F7090D3